jgi:hypothetical protein
MHRQQVERLSEAGQCLNDGYPEPFVWTADPDNLIAAARRGYQNVRFDPLVGPDDRCGLRPVQVTPTQRI